MTKEKRIYTPAVSTVIESIINDLNNNNGNLKETLKITNFKSIPELAIYMKENNYKWNGNIKNYVQVTGVINSKDQKPFKKTDVTIESSGAEKIKGEQILLFIKNNKEQIKKLMFDGENTPNSMPRYCVSGRNITKSLYMIDSVADLIGKFSREKHISQGEVAMIAFIEFFKKYGFEHEINKISD